MSAFATVTIEQLPEWLRHHPAPITDRNDETLVALNGKPATIVTRLSGAPVLNRSPSHCGPVGNVLGRMLEWRREDAEYLS